jgi:DNA-binding transcriptional regulator YiaG
MTAWDDDALAVLQAYRRTPALAGALRLRVYLPANLESQLRARLAAVGIEAVDDGEDGASLLQAPAPRHVAPAALRLARQRAGWTQAALARRIGVTAMTVSLWERGRKSIPRSRAAAFRRIFAAYWSAPPLAGARPGAMSRAG